MVDEIRDELLDLRDVMDFYIPRPTIGHPFKMKIRPGVYALDYALREERIPNPQSFCVESDEIFVFQDKASIALRREIVEFWNMGKQMQKEGLLHKRGILIYGPPASGKTTFIKNEIKALEERDHVIFISKSPYVLSESIRVFRKLEPYRALTVIIEDIDEITKSWGEHSLLEMLDGADTVNHILFIATTNNMEALSAKMRRKGRLDTKIEIPLPNADMRRIYLERKFGARMNPAMVTKMVKLTEGLNFGHLRDLVVQTQGYRIPIEEAVGQMRQDILVESKQRNSRGMSRLLESFSDEDCEEDWKCAK